jgi:uncharacterized protein (TIGR03067 family)
MRRFPWAIAALVFSTLGPWPPPTVRAEERADERELEALQGCWVAIHCVEGGKLVEDDTKRRLIIDGHRCIYEENGNELAKGKVLLRATKDPKHLDFEWSSGQTDVTIYVRAGDYIIQCGNRDGKTRPVEFRSGVEGGGAFLTIWKIKR